MCYWLFMHTCQQPAVLYKSGHPVLRGMGDSEGDSPWVAGAYIQQNTHAQNSDPFVRNHDVSASTSLGEI